MLLTLSMRTGVYNAETGRVIYAFLHARILTVKCQSPIVLNVAVQLESRREAYHGNESFRYLS